MNFLDSVRHLAKTPLNALLKPESLRRRLKFELQQNYYHSLDIAVPMGYGLSCPIYFQQAWSSFIEVFMTREYNSAFQLMPLPSRWLDLGCYAGYFSLFVIWLRAQQQLPMDFSALLVDGDPRLKPAIDRLITQNKLEQHLTFIHGVISSQSGQQNFYQRDHMSSSLLPDESNPQAACWAPVLSAEQLMQLFPPPYDLIKLDIEGSEFDFLTKYSPLLEHSRFLLLEWHSWHTGGGGSAQLNELAIENGFQLLSEVLPAHDVLVNGSLNQCGVSLYQSQSLPSNQ